MVLMAKETGRERKSICLFSFSLFFLFFDLFSFFVNSFDILFHFLSFSCISMPLYLSVYLSE